jgi:transposase
MYEFFLNQKGLHATDEASLRLFVEAVFCRVRSGCQWRLLHSDYGDWRAIHKQFLLWCKNNIWEKLLHAVQKNPDLEAIMVDATIVRAHACAAGYGKDSQAKEALGRSRGGFTTKIHAAVDSLGNILRFFLTPGQRNEITQAEDLN